MTSRTKTTPNKRRGQQMRRRRPKALRVHEEVYSALPGRPNTAAAAPAAKRRSRPSCVSAWSSSGGARPEVGAVAVAASRAAAVVEQSAASRELGPRKLADEQLEQRRQVDGPRTRLRFAEEQKNKPQTSTIQPTTCHCRHSIRWDTSRPVSLLKHKIVRRSNQMIISQQHRQQQQQRPRRSHQMPSTSGGRQDQSSVRSAPFGQANRQQDPIVGGYNSNQSPQESQNQMEMIKKVSRELIWTWSETDTAHFASQCQINPLDKLEVCFHPRGSESTAACRGDKPLIRNGNYYYWELTVSEKCYGTSVMFGLCTLRQNLHALDYCNLIGLDESGWSLSHKGLIWHNGKNRQFTSNFPANQQITIGLLLNTMQGELSYFMDGKNLGVAFCGLNDIEDELYPVVGSTAKNTKVRITGSYCGYVSLLERSCFTILKNHSQNNKEQLLEYLNQCKLPKNLIEYLSQAAGLCGSSTAIKTIKQPTLPTNHNNTTTRPQMIIA